MTRVGTLKQQPDEVVFDTRTNKAFSKFETNLKAIDRMKEMFREKSFKNKGLLSVGIIGRFLSGAKKSIVLQEFGEKREYKRRTVEAYQRRLKNLKIRFKGGATIGRLIKGMDRKSSKTQDKNSPLFGTSRKSRISDIQSFKLYKMDDSLAIFRVTASGKTKGAPSHYQVKVRFSGWTDGMDENKNSKAYVRGFQYAMNQPVRIHCTCDDFKYQYGLPFGFGTASRKTGVRLKKQSFTMY